MGKPMRCPGRRQIDRLPVEKRGKPLLCQPSRTRGPQAAGRMKGSPDARNARGPACAAQARPARLQPNASGQALAYFRAPRSSVTAACSDSGVATDAGTGSPTASVSRLITPRLIGRGIRASECREK